MIQKIWKIVVGLAILALIYITVSDWRQAQWENSGPASDFEAQVINLGFVGSISDSFAFKGKAALVAAQLAVNEINEAGGVNGKGLRLIVEDGNCNPRTALQAGEKLNDAQVAAIIGGQCSTESISLVNVIDSQVPIVSYCSSADALSGAADNFFRVFPADRYQSAFAAEHIYRNLGVRNVAVFNVDDEWGYGLQDSFVTEFESLGGSVDLIQTFRAQGADFRRALRLLEERPVELIYFAGFSTVTFFEQLADSNIEVMTFGADAWDDNDLWEQIGDLGSGAMYTTPYIDLNEDFAAKMARRGIYNVPVCAATAYDAVYLVADALSSSVSSEETLSSLADTQHAGISFDMVSFDENGDLVGGTYEVVTVR